MHAFNLSIRKAEFKANSVYKMSYNSSRAIQRNSVSRKEGRKKKGWREGRREEREERKDR